MLHSYLPDVTFYGIVYKSYTDNITDSLRPLNTAVDNTMLSCHTETVHHCIKKPSSVFTVFIPASVSYLTLK